MSKTKTETPDVEASPAPEVSQDYRREIALQIALTHHKTNGGMLNAQQLIENAKIFHAYIAGETQ